MSEFDRWCAPLLNSAWSLSCHENVLNSHFYSEWKASQIVCDDNYCVNSIKAFVISSNNWITNQLKKMNAKLIIVSLLAVVYTTSALVCPKNYCSTVDCGNKVEQNDCEQNQNGIFRERGTWCGCCPACLTKLLAGDNCYGVLIRGPPPKVACDAGLRCDFQTETCVRV